jgi:hypothetical protein
LISSTVPSELEGRAATSVAGVDVNFLATLGNLVQLVGIFISVLAGVSAAKQTATALDQAEERLAGLQRDVAELDLQLRRAKRGR